jgi:hypothetical protein
MNTHHPGSRHDAFFSWLTSNLSYARQLLACILPALLLEELDLPRMDDNILRGTVDFLACARMLRSVLQPDLPTRLRDIFLGLESRLVEAGNGHESPDSPLPTILSYASSQIDRSELEQIIDQTFEDNPMIKAQLMKSAADVWFEEGRLKGLEQGRSEGLELGFLMAEIQFLQRQLKQPVSSKSQLEQLPFEDLTALAGRLRPLAEQN